MPVRFAECVICIFRIKEGVEHRVTLDEQAKEFVPYKHVHTHNELESLSYEEGATAEATREETG